MTAPRTRNAHRVLAVAALAIAVAAITWFAGHHRIGVAAAAIGAIATIIVTQYLLNLEDRR